MQSELPEIDKKLVNALNNEEWEEVKILLKSGANVHVNNGYPIYCAVWKRNINMILYLLNSQELEENANLKNPEILSICLNFKDLYIPILEKLIDNGLDIHCNDSEALITAIEKKNLAAVKFLHEHGIDLTAQCNKAVKIAFNKEAYNILEYLFENGVDKHIEEEILLQNAVAKKNLVMGDFLIKQGLDLNIAKINKLKEVEIKSNSYHFGINSEEKQIKINFVNNLFNSFKEQQEILTKNNLNIQPKKGYLPLSTNLNFYTIQFLKDNNLPYVLEDYETLQMVIKNKMFDLADYMLDNGMDINYNQASFLIQSIMQEDFESMYYLESKGASFKIAAERLPTKATIISEYEIYINMEKNIPNKSTINKKKI